MRDWAQHPYAFVHFKNHRDADACLLMANRTILDGRPIRIERAKVNRTVFISNCFAHSEKEDISKIMGQFGPVESVTLLQNHQTGCSRGCGFVKFFHREDAIISVKLLRLYSKWTVDWASDLKKDPVELYRRSVFVGRLNATQVTRINLAQKFGEFGEIELIQLKNKFSDSKGSILRYLPFMQPLDTFRPAFAFINYKNFESAAEAVEQTVLLVSKLII